MYSGALLLFWGTPLALGSCWGELGAGALTVSIMVRLLDEEAYLADNLQGYTDYQHKVRLRLVPLIW